MNNPTLNNPASAHDCISNCNLDDDNHLSSVDVAEPSLSSSSRVSTPINMATAVYDKTQLPEHAHLPPQPPSSDDSQTVRPDTENGSQNGSQAGDGHGGSGSGASRDRPPPAEQLGKKKIVVIITALCVCDLSGLDLDLDLDLDGG